MPKAARLLFLLACVAFGSQPVLWAQDYWNEAGGGFDAKYTSMNYQRSSVFLAGGTKLHSLPLPCWPIRLQAD